MSVTKYTPIEIHASDSTPESANIPTAQQLNKQPQPNGSFDFYAQVPHNSPKEITWRIKLASMLVDKLEPERKGDGRTYILMGFPNAYTLYEHVRQPAEGTPQTASTKRQDVYLYGYPNSRKRYRSPAEFFPHLLWLATTGGSDRRWCGCTMCGGTPQPVTANANPQASPVVTAALAPAGINAPPPPAAAAGGPSEAGPPAQVQSPAGRAKVNSQSPMVAPSQISQQRSVVDMNQSPSLAPNNNIPQRQAQKTPLQHHPQLAPPPPPQQQQQYQQYLQHQQQQHLQQSPPPHHQQQQQQQQQPPPPPQQRQQRQPPQGPPHQHHQPPPQPPQPQPPQQYQQPPPPQPRQVQYQQAYPTMIDQTRSPVMLQHQPPQPHMQQQEPGNAVQVAQMRQHPGQVDQTHSPIMHQQPQPQPQQPQQQPHYSTAQEPIEMAWSMDDMESVIHVGGGIPSDSYVLPEDHYQGDGGMSLEDDDEAFLRSLVPNPNNKMP